MLVASGSPDAAARISWQPSTTFPDTRFGRFDRWYTTWTKWLSYVAGLALLSVVIVCVVDVLGWKLFGKPFPSAVDFIKYMNVALVFLAVAYVQTDRGSIAIELGQDHFPALAQGVGADSSATSWDSPPACGSCTAVSSASTSCGRRTRPPQDVWKFPLWPFEVCLLVGMFFLAWGFVVTGIRDLVHFKNRTGRYAPSKNELKKSKTGVTPPASL